jgi:hypothetical protein
MKKNSMYFREIHYRANFSVVAVYLFCSLSLSSCNSLPLYVYKGLEKDPLAAMEFNSKPKGGYVRAPETAAKIAEAIGKEFYGEEVVEKQKPLLVTKSNDIWVVRGTFEIGSGKKGGSIEMRISSDDGKILGMIHGE